MKAHCPSVPGLRLSTPQHARPVQLRGVAVEGEVEATSLVTGHQSHLFAAAYLAEAGHPPRHLCIHFR